MVNADLRVYDTRNDDEERKKVYTDGKNKMLSKTKNEYTCITAPHMLDLLLNFRRGASQARSWGSEISRTPSSPHAI